MSFIDIPTEDVPDVVVLPEGDHELKVASCQQENSKAGNPQIVTILESVHEPNADSMYHYCGLPNPNQTDKQRAQSLRNLKEFKEGMGFPHTGQVDLSEAVGKTIWGNVGVENFKGKEQNRFNGFVKKVAE